MATARATSAGQNFWRYWSRIAPLLADIALTSVVVLLALATAIGAARRQEIIVSWWSIALILLSALPLLIRRYYPIAILIVAEVAQTLYFVTVALQNAPTIIGLLVALYTMTSLVERPISLRIVGCVGIVNALTLLGGVILDRPGAWTSLFVTTAFLLGGWGLGDSIRARRAYLLQLEERARRLELEREEGARRAVQEERTRIARELHDIVAHHVSAIAVQAAAAAEIVTRDPQAARNALEFIQGTSRQALTEMRALLAVLRSNDDPDADRAPQPSLTQIDHLLNQSRATGLPVTLQIEGTIRPLPEALDLSAYRIVQEALTNSLKHAGPTEAAVVIRYEQEALELTINDTGRGMSGEFADNGDGRGLIGMRERVALFDGELFTGSTQQRGFTVKARFPCGRNDDQCPHRR